MVMISLVSGVHASIKWTGRPCFHTDRKKYKSTADRCAAADSEVSGEIRTVDKVIYSNNTGDNLGLYAEPTTPE